LISSEPGVTVSSSKWRDTSLSLAAPVLGDSGEGAFSQYQHLINKKRNYSVG
jgi:hypothetical protein